MQTWRESLRVNPARRVQTAHPAVMRWRCHACGETFKAYAPAERHVVGAHPPGGRIELIFEPR